MIKGTITSINISKEKGVIKTPVDSAVCKCDHGIVGDAHAGNWHRQISLLAQESIDIMTEMGIDDLTPGQFAENLTTEGICLYELPVGTRLQIGHRGNCGGSHPDWQGMSQRLCHSAESRQMHYAYPGYLHQSYQRGNPSCG